MLLPVSGPTNSPCPVSGAMEGNGPSICSVFLGLLQSSLLCTPWSLLVMSDYSQTYPPDFTKAYAAVSCNVMTRKLTET